MKKAFTIIGLICSVTTPSFATIGFEDAVFPELVTSARALAMGNAYICSVDDAWSAFYNPAGLGTVRRMRFHPTNLHLELNKGFTDTSFGGNVEDSASNLGEIFDEDGQRQLLLQNRGQIMHARVNAFPNITSRFFTLGYMFSARNRATIGKQDTATYEYAYRRDHGPVMGLNLSLWGGVFKLGASMVMLNRREVDTEFDRTQTAEVTDAMWKDGTMNYVTAGARLTFPIPWNPTFAAVMRNTSDSAFNNDTNDDTTLPTAIPQTVDAGFSITPKVSNVSRVHIEVNVKDLNNHWEDVESSRKVGFGIEYDYKRMIYIRFGSGDGFGSGGIGIRGKRLVVDLTTYAVDTTADEFRGQEDRRFVLSVASGF